MGVLQSIHADFIAVVVGRELTALSFARGRKHKAVNDLVKYCGWCGSDNQEFAQWILSNYAACLIRLVVA